MKTRTIQGWMTALTISALPFVAGCEQKGDSASANAGVVATAAAQPVAPAAEDFAPIAADATDVEGDMEPQPVPPLIPPAQKPLPANIRSNSPVAEIVKLARSGVGEEVMLSYVGDSRGLFNLGSDEIIFLNDLGVPDSVVTAMIERDQILKQAWASGGRAVAPAAVPADQPQAEEQFTAAAPSYENPPAEQAYVEPQPTVVNYNYFYDTLSPYGSWVSVPGYGYCWQPTVVTINPQWQPYGHNGRWLYTDHGWYWQSDYSWGLTFHYGRWFRHSRLGWCWWPDRVWGPSWVTWRYSGDYCGWAPLPPRTHYRSGFGLSYFSGSVGVGFSFGLASDCYTFVPWRGFCDPHPFRNRLPHHRVKNVFNNTTIVNNFHRGDHRRVVNRGISPDRVSEFSGRRVNEVALGNAERRTVRGWQRDNDGDSSRREMARRTDAPAGAFAPAATRGDNDRSRRLEGGNSLAERQGRMLNQRSGERDDNTPDSAPDFRRGNVRSEVSRSDDNQRGDAASPIMRRSVGGIGDNERDNNSRNLPSRFQRDQRIAEAPGRDDNSPQATPSPDNRGHPSVVIRQTPSRDLSRPNRFTPPSTTTTPVAPSTTQPRQIGRAQAAAPTLDARSRSTHTWTAPERTQSPVQRQEIQRPEIQRPQVQRPQIQRQEIQRQDVSRFTPQIRNQSQSPPSRFQPSPTPRANVPSQPRTVTPSFPAPERSRPIPQQRFTPAPVQRAPSVESRPAPSREVRSQPAQSNSRGSDGGDNSRGGGGGNRGGGGDGGGRSRR